MSTEAVKPNDIHAPGGAYSHGVVTRGAGRTLFISGQVGVSPDGVVAEGFEAQAVQSWRNVVTVLESGGMGVGDLVKLTIFLTDMSHVGSFGQIRALFLGDARPASTLVATPALVRPEWLVEIEAVAFRND